MTLISAMAVALGYTHLAKASEAEIMRKNPRVPGGRELIRVDLKKVLSLHAPDQQLIANDILFVPESGAKRTLDTLTSGLISAGTSASVYRVAY